MKARRLITGTLAGAMLLLTGGTAAYGAPDPTYPTGTFTLDRTSTYLHDNFLDDSEPYASFRVTGSNLSDDSTAPEDLVVQADPGNGSGFHTCNATGYCTIAYSTTGTFTPVVRLTDEDHHTTEYTLPSVTVRPDHTAPTVRLTAPKPRLRHHKAAWRVIRGTASDSGIGLNWVKVIVLQKRHGWWYFYNPYQHKWHKGLRTEAATDKKFGPPGGDAVLGAGHTWHSPRVRGLTRGAIVVRVWAQDNNANQFDAKILARGRITRR